MLEMHLPAANTPNVLTVLNGPDRRLRLIALLTAIPVVIVFLRLSEMQSSTKQLLVPNRGAVRSSLEQIPARNGRIISSDGRILAQDIQTFSLLVHYRWFETPAHPQWLRGEALRMLTPKERRQRESVLAAEQAVLARREELWQELVKCSGLDHAKLTERFAKRQRQVVELRKSVEDQRDAASHEAVAGDPSSPATTWWEAGARTVWRAITTSPRPALEEPLILKEELDHHEIVGGLPLAAAAEIESHPERFPGTRVRLSGRREYPLGTTAAHIVGFRFNDDVARSGVLTSTSSGQAGIERSYERHLRGIDGLRRIWQDRRGETVRTEVVKEARVGRDVVLNLDCGLQTEIEHVLDKALTRIRSTPEAAVPASAGGSIVVLDLRSGAVLASASAPRFDLNQAANRDASLWDGLAEDAATPMFNRVISAALPPGSVFKTVTAAAILQSDKIDPDEPFDCVGYLNRKDRHRDYIFTHFGVGHGPTTLTTALAESCNVYFFRAARLLGPQPMLTWAERFGFGQRTGIDLPSESSGNLPSNAAGADALGISIGQADVTATPLQVVRATAAIANGGRLVTPHVVRGSGPVRDDSESVRPLLRSHMIEQLEPVHLDRMREGLEQVVSHPRGSGYKTVRHAHIDIAGKTGTAEVGGDRPDHAWFAGYAPADDPQYAFVVVLENAGSGGQAAGPVAKASVDALLHGGFFR